MKYLISLLSLMVFYPAFSQDIEHYEVLKINTELVMDGLLDEDAWLNVESTSDFVILGIDKEAARNITWSKMLWDDNYLYVAFYCEDSILWAEYVDRDDPLYKEDVVEVYIDPDGDGENYLEIEISPMNTVFDLWLTKPRNQGGEADVPWTMEGLKSGSTYSGTLNDNSDNDTSWICEMALPFEAMKFSADPGIFPPKAEDVWRFNLYRFDRSFNNDPEGEATGWSQTGGGQHVPDKFGEIVFLGRDPQVGYVQEYSNAGKKISLKQNSPNPLGDLTSISYQIRSNNTVSLNIYDYQGREVAMLVNEHKLAGAYESVFDAGHLPEGLYFYKLVAGSESTTKKMLIAR
ncbi:MAG: sugar-binding protein [Bacteroides sp.]|nr:sugar-binding protein [Bacteroides sp.]